MEFNRPYGRQWSRIVAYHANNAFTLARLCRVLCVAKNYTLCVDIELDERKREYENMGWQQSIYTKYNEISNFIT